MRQKDAGPIFSRTSLLCHKQGVLRSYTNLFAKHFWREGESNPTPALSHRCSLLHHSLLLLSGLRGQAFQKEPHLKFYLVPLRKPRKNTARFVSCSSELLARYDLCAAPLFRISAAEHEYTWVGTRPRLPRLAASPLLSYFTATSERPCRPILRKIGELL